MTERSAEQAPVQTRPDTRDTSADTPADTSRIPLAERLQRRISAADERRTTGREARESEPGRGSGRVLPPPPPELSRPSVPPASTAPAVERNGRAAQDTQTQPVVSARQPAPVQPAPLPSAAPATAAATTTSPAPEPVTATTRRTPAPSRAPRRARLRLSRIDPWSVMKVSFLLSIAFGIVTVVSVFMVWSVLGAAGVWSSINNTVSDTVSSGNHASTFDITNYLGMSRVLGFTMLVSVIDVVLITAIATLGAFLYNMAASLLGGIEVTLAEDQV
jgi:hypothetical protein